MVIAQEIAGKITGREKDLRGILHSQTATRLQVRRDTISFLISVYWGFEQDVVVAPPPDENVSPRLEDAVSRYLVERHERLHADRQAPLARVCSC